MVYCVKNFPNLNLPCILKTKLYMNLCPDPFIECLAKKLEINHKSSNFKNIKNDRTLVGGYFIFKIFIAVVLVW